MVGGSCPSRSRESPNGALTFASNHGLGMAIAQFDLANWSVGCIDLPRELSLRRSSRIVLGTALDSSISRSERPSGRGRSQAGASFGSITIRSPGSFAPLARFASFN
jgi:hypothetical protein